MKKSFLIVAISFVLLGLMVGVCGLFLMNFDFNSLNTEKEIEKIYEITEDFSSVSINSKTARVNILVSEGDECRVEIKESATRFYTISVKDGKLLIKENDTRRWYQYIGIITLSHTINLYMPAGQYDALNINTDTGDIKVQGGFEFDVAQVVGDTSDIEFYANVKSKFECETDTGDIKISGVNASAINVESDTGDIIIANVNAENIKLDGDTSKLKLQNINCKNIEIESDTGKVNLIGVIAENSMKIKVATCDVYLDACDAADINIQTGTGDVEGTLLTNKVFVTNAGTGKINVPESYEGGKCNIKTGTGDIKISIVDANN